VQTASRSPTCPKRGWHSTPVGSSLLSNLRAGPVALQSNRLAKGSLHPISALRDQNSNGSCARFHRRTTRDGWDARDWLSIFLCSQFRRCAPSDAYLIARTTGWFGHEVGNQWAWTWKFRTSDRHVRFDPDKSAGMFLVTETSAVVVRPRTRYVPCRPHK